MISHKYKCVFIHIPKCAGTSIESALGHLDNHVGRGGQDHRTIRMIEKPLFTPRIFSSRENLYEVLRRIKHQYYRRMYHEIKLLLLKSSTIAILNLPSYAILGQGLFPGT